MTAQLGPDRSMELFQFYEAAVHLVAGGLLVQQAAAL